MPKVQCFRYDHWELVEVDHLQENDLIAHQGVVGVVKAPSQKSAEGWVINARQVEEGPIIVDLFGVSTPSREVMDMLCLSLQEFEDGTCMLLDDSVIPSNIFSPRLPRTELDAFCLTHMDRYEAFNALHGDSIMDGQSVAIEHWWPYHSPLAAD